MHHSSKSKKHEKPKEDINPEVFHEIFEKDRKKLEFMQSLNVSGDPKFSPPHARKEYSTNNSGNFSQQSGASGVQHTDQDFYNSLNAHKHHEAPAISPALFEDMIRRDKIKKDFVKKFTNVYDTHDERPISQRSPVIQYAGHQRTASPSSGRSSRHESPSRRVITERGAQRSGSPSSYGNPPYPTARGESLILASDQGRNAVRILHSDLGKSTEAEIASYLDKYWNSECPFPSVYPMLLKLERETGPGWRLDKIGDKSKVNSDAWPNSTINFDFPPQRTMYSVWRQRV